MCSKQNSDCCKKANASVELKDESDQIRQAVREHYGGIVSEQKPTRCCSVGGSCFGANITVDYAAVLGYSEADLNQVPEGVNLGLGCGNPLAFTQICPGDTVLDLGSGSGFDVFIAAKKTGPNGLVIGVDMTPEMVSKAREKAAKNGINNVNFRLGEIEHLPVADSSVDLIISNCVLNLSPQKKQVLVEAFRVLKPGGRFVISDIVSVAELPENIRKNLAMYAGCLAGATRVSDLEEYFTDIGYVDVSIKKKNGSDELIQSWSPKDHLDQFVYSAVIQASKPN